MNGLRYALSILTLAALVGGYAASQFALWGGDVDRQLAGFQTPWVRWASLGLVVGAVLLAIMPREESKP